MRKMKQMLVFLFLCFVHGEAIFSKLMHRGKSETNDEYVDICETVKVMPRVALAVVGGAPLRAENSAPYIAAVGEKLSNGSTLWFCGGSLVSSQHILTAAHCLVSRNVTTIRVGSFSTRKNPTENDYKIVDTVIHPEYKITESYNDIAIIKVKDKIMFSRNIKPVCLPEYDNEKYDKEKAKVIGWGAEEFGGEGTQKLQQVEVEVYTNQQCENAYSNSTIAPKTFPRGIRKEQLCAGSPKGGKDACQGDSGGPLVLTDGTGVVRQIGIVSTGAGCGSKMYPGVYVRVSSYKNWIEKQINTKPSSKLQGSSEINYKSHSTPRRPPNNNNNNYSNNNNNKSNLGYDAASSSKEKESLNHKNQRPSKDENFQSNITKLDSNHGRNSKSNASDYFNSNSGSRETLSFREHLSHKNNTNSSY